MTKQELIEAILDILTYTDDAADACNAVMALLYAEKYDAKEDTDENAG